MTATARPFTSRRVDGFAFRDIIYDKRDGVARVTINRPQHYNAYSTAALEELAAAFRDAGFDDAVGVIVFTGAGDRAFCTGGDVKEYAAAYVGAPRDYWKYMALFRAYIESILNTGKPVIARINGMAVSMKPGATTFTVTPSRASSSARERASPMRPAFAAA